VDGVAAEVRPNRLRRVAWPGAVIAAVALFIPRVLTSARETRGEIAAYWTAAHLVSEKARVERFYDDEAFQSSVHALGIAQNDIWYPNPPSTALVFLPLAGFSYETAKLVWLALSSVLTLATVAWLAHAARLRGAFLVAFVLFGLHGQPVISNLRHGQIYALVTALIALAAAGFRDARWWTFGGALGMLAGVKLAGSHLWLLTVSKRSRLALRWGLATTGAAVALSIPCVGVAGWRAFLSVPVRIARDTSFAVTAFQSLGGLLRRLFVPDAAWNPHPLFDAPLLAGALTIASQAALAGIVLFLAFRGRNRTLTFSAAVLAGLGASPCSQDYTYSQPVVPAALILAALQESPRPGPVLAALGALLLIGGSDWHKATALQDGAAVLLAYPKVYGALLLFLLALRLSRERDVTGSFQTTERESVDSGSESGAQQ
jgi:hypothetical protein